MSNTATQIDRTKRLRVAVRLPDTRVHRKAYDATTVTMEQVHSDAAQRDPSVLQGPLANEFRLRAQNGKVLPRSGLLVDAVPSAKALMGRDLELALQLTRSPGSTVALNTGLAKSIDAKQRSNTPLTHTTTAQAAVAPPRAAAAAAATATATATAGAPQTHAARVGSEETAKATRKVSLGFEDLEECLPVVAEPPSGRPRLATELASPRAPPAADGGSGTGGAPHSAPTLSATPPPASATSNGAHTSTATAASGTSQPSSQQQQLAQPKPVTPMRPQISPRVSRSNLSPSASSGTASPTNTGGSNATLGVPSAELNPILSPRHRGPGTISASRAPPSGGAPSANSASANTSAAATGAGTATAASASIAAAAANSDASSTSAKASAAARLEPPPNARPQLSQGAPLSEPVRDLLARVVAWAQKRRTVEKQQQQLSARKSRLLHASAPTFPIFFVLPDATLVRRTCRRDATLAEVKRAVLAERDGGTLRSEAALRVIRVRQIVRRMRPVRVERHGALRSAAAASVTELTDELSESLTLESVSSITLERMAGLTPMLVLERAKRVESDVDERSKACIRQLVGGILSWKDSNTGIDASREEMDAFVEAMYTLRCEAKVQRKRELEARKNVTLRRGNDGNNGLLVAGAARPAPSSMPAPTGNTLVLVKVPHSQAQANGMLLKENQCGDQLLQEVFAKHCEPQRARVDALRDKTWRDYVLRIDDTVDEFVFGTEPVHSARRVREQLLANVRPKFELVERSAMERTLEAAVQREERELAEGAAVPAEDLIEASPCETFNFDGSALAAVSAPSWEQMHVISQWDLRKDVRIKIVGVENLGPRGTLYWRTAKTRKILETVPGGEGVDGVLGAGAATGGGGGGGGGDGGGGGGTAGERESDEYSVYVEVSIYHGGELLGNTMHTKSVKLCDAPRWCEWISCGVQIRDVPSAARLCFTLYTVEGNVPLGWVNMSLFDFRRRLLQGQQSLSLWPDGPANPIGTLVSNLQPNIPALCVALDEYVLPVVAPTAPLKDDIDDVKASADSGGDLPPEERNRVREIAAKDPLYKLSDEEKEFLWHNRYKVAQVEAKIIPKLLLSVPPSSRRAWQQTHQILERVPLLEPSAALELLDSSYVDWKVREYAVRCVNRYKDEELRKILLQLVQVIKYEPSHNSALSRMLLRRAMSNRRFAHEFFWLLKSELHVQDIAQRYGLLLQAYLKGSGTHMFDLTEQNRFVQDLTKVAKAIKLSKAAERLDVERKMLAEIEFNKPIQSPLDPSMGVLGFNVDRCKYMDSKKKPLFLLSKAQRFGGGDATDDAATAAAAAEKASDYYIIFKEGDDLRQDQLTIQMFRLMASIWDNSSIDVTLIPYGVVATGDEIGLIEVVTNSETTASITRSHGGAKAALRSHAMLKWLQKNNPNEREMKAAVERFARSLAASCVATYVLGIGDRHNDNIMIKKDGTLFHIDFGHFLGNFKSKFGFKRERAPFVFTPDFAKVLGGKDGEMFAFFRKLCFEAYNEIRKHANLFISLFMMMLSTGIPELQRASDIEYLRNVLLLDATDEEAEEHFNKLIYEALSTKTTQLNNFIHIMAH